MKLSRRSLLGLALGAGQLALLHRFGMNRAFAAPPTGAPTKLLSVYLPGGVSWEQVFCALTPSGVDKYIPAPTNSPYGPFFFSKDMVGNYDGTTGDDGPYQKIRGPIHWNKNDPTDGSSNPATGGQQPYWNHGYSWATKQLTDQSICERAVMVHGVDQGTNAHSSGLVASMCGVAGGDFRAPAIAAVVANAMMTPFPDRVLPSVSIRGRLNPKVVSSSSFPISGAASPAFLMSTAGAQYSISDHPDAGWAGLRTRHDIEDVGFDGASLGGVLPATAVEEQVLKALRAQRGRSTPGTDAIYEQLHDTYRGVSRALAKDVVTVLQNTKGIEHLVDPVPWKPNGTSTNFGFLLNTSGGSAHGWDSEFDLALRLLKSDLTTAVTLHAGGDANFNFDTHSGADASATHINYLRGTFEVLGQLFLEMMLTPAPGQPGRTLLDDTLVHIYSDFGRTTSGGGGTDHHPATSVILVGGGVHGNRSIGGYDESVASSPLGKPVEIINIEEGANTTTMRVPTAADAAATVYRAFGLEGGKDFFIPGGYGEVKGVLEA